MINPQNIIDYNRTEAEKQELLMFLVCVAGKKATTVAKQLENYLHPMAEYTPTGKLKKSHQTGLTPFEVVKFQNILGILEDRLRQVRFGQYNRISKAFTQMAESGLDLDTCTLQDLMKIHGIGRKSASCFLMWTRRGQRVSGLDTHLLKYLRNLKKDFNDALAVGVKFNKGHNEVITLLNSVEIPKSTPGSKKVYDALEQAFLLSADLTGQTPEDWDLWIWKRYANKGVDNELTPSL